MKEDKGKSEKRNPDAVVGLWDFTFEISFFGENHKLFDRSLSILHYSA